MRRVKITKLPQKHSGGQGTASNGYNNSVPEQNSNFGGGTNRGHGNISDMSIRRTLQPVPREEANLEAEKGEVAYGDINGDRFAETYVIGGKRHSNGGTFLNLPEGTYIFSDFRDMKIKDPRILAMFGKMNAKGKAKKAGGYTPAELAAQYDINKSRGILQDPNSDKNDIMTAELMIKEYQMKLGALALASESKKNFEQGIPDVARPYMEKMGIRDEDILPAEQLQHEQSETAQYEQMEGPESQEDMMQQMPMAQKGGFLPAYQTYGQVEDIPQIGETPPQFQDFNQQANNPFGLGLSVGSENGFGVNAGYNTMLQEGKPTGSSYNVGVQNIPLFGGKMGVTGSYNTPQQPVLGRAPSNKGNLNVGVNYNRRLGNSETGTNLRLSGYYGNPRMQEGGQLTKYQKGDEVKSNGLPAYDREDLQTTWAGVQGPAQVYQSLEEAFGDEELGPKFQEMFVTSVRDAMKDKERYKGKKGGYSKTWEEKYGKVDDLSKDEIIKAFLTHQKRNLVLQAQGVQPTFFSDANGTLKSAADIQKLDKGDGKTKYSKEEAESIVKNLKDKGYTSLNKTFTSLGLPLGDSKQSTLEQATFHGFDKMLKNRGTYSPEEQAMLKPWKDNLQRGESDEPGSDVYGKMISPIDSVYTNTTAGHLVGLALDQQTDPDAEVKVDENTVIDPEELNIPQALPENAPWWLQDSINIAGSVIDKSKIQDQYPWAPSPDLEEVQLMKTDPTRELAGLSERYGTAANAMASMMPGQSYAANLRAMSGAGDIANTLSTYNNQNVLIQNQEDMANNQIRNQETGLRQATTKQLYDDTMRTMANAQMQDLAFDREKRGLLTQGITNKEQTNALNQMYPQFAVDPSIGGRMHYTGPGKPGQPEQGQDFDSLVNKYRSQGMDADQAYKYAIFALKQASGNTGGYSLPNLQAVQQMYNVQRGGFVTGSNTYPFGH